MPNNPQYSPAPPQAPPPTPVELETDELTAEEKLAAVYEGSGRFKTVKALAEYLGRSVVWVYHLRKQPAYQDAVQAIVADIARRMTDSAADISEMFNAQIKPSVETLVEVRDNPFEKAGDRIKASLGLIDHAPAAPKAKEATGAHLVLQIPVPQLEGIKEALADEGEGELIELLAGEDFREVGESVYEEPPAPGEDFRVPVREIE